MHVTGVRITGKREMLFCAADALNLAAGDKVRVQISPEGELAVGTIAIPAQLLEVNQIGQDLPVIVGLAEPTVVVPSAPSASLKSACDREPCCTMWLAPFPDAVAQVAPCCLENATSPELGSAVCSMETRPNSFAKKPREKETN